MSNELGLAQWIVDDLLEGEDTGSGIHAREQIENLELLKRLLLEVGAQMDDPAPISAYYHFDSPGSPHSEDY